MSRSFRQLSVSLAMSILFVGQGFAASVSESFNSEPFAAMKYTEGFRQRINARSAEIETIESGFVQEKHLEIFSNPVVSKGRFYFKKPANVRWEYLSPFTYRIIIAGNDITIYNDGSTEHYDTGSNKMFSEINRRITETVRGDIVKNNNDFSYEYFENSAEYLVRLRPLNKQIQEFISAIKVYFDKSDATIDRIEVSEPSNDFMKIRFEGKKINQGIDDSIFKAH